MTSHMAPKKLQKLLHLLRLGVISASLIKEFWEILKHHLVGALLGTVNALCGNTHNRVTIKWLAIPVAIQDTYRFVKHLGLLCMQLLCSYPLLDERTLTWQIIRECDTMRSGIEAAVTTHVYCSCMLTGQRHELPLLNSLAADISTATHTTESWSCVMDSNQGRHQLSGILQASVQVYNLFEYYCQVRSMCHAGRWMNGSLVYM